jgi:hypothetical protein
MVTLSVVGGFYVERCIEPQWNEIFGSGGRAAAAVAGAGTPVRFHTYVADRHLNDAQAFATQWDIELIRSPSDRMVAFDYFHPLSTPGISPVPGRLESLPPIRVEGEVVLRFGMLEGDAIVKADRVVYDPQSAFSTPRFTDNGSQANHLALVLNRVEATTMSGESDPVKAAEKLLRSGAAEAVIIKRGAHGALVATNASQSLIPAYQSDWVWKIGSGDVFSAVFAYYWGVQNLEPAAAAELASRATAHYAGTRHLPVPGKSHLENMSLTPTKFGKGLVYLAGPFFDMGQRWLIEEAKADLEAMGVEVFSPIHEVGPGPAEVIAAADLEGLERSSAVLAIVSGMDPGTVFEIGYATKMGIPIVALAQNVKPEDVKMIAGSGAIITSDYCTAIYKTSWCLPA